MSSNGGLSAGGSSGAGRGGNDGGSTSGSGGTPHAGNSGGGAVGGGGAAGMSSTATGPLLNNYDGARATSVSFDLGWRFHLGDVSGAQDAAFDDSAWTSLDVPHDWSISLPFNQSSTATFEGGYLDGGLARFGKSYVGEPDQIVAELATDAAVQAADTVLVTIPNQLGVAYNAKLLESIVTHVAPGLGWR